MDHKYKWKIVSLKDFHFDNFGQKDLDYFDHDQLVKNKNTSIFYDLVQLVGSSCSTNGYQDYIYIYIYIYVCVCVWEEFEISYSISVSDILIESQYIVKITEFLNV